MVATQAAPQPPATPEEIWAILRETAQRQKEHEERWNREIAMREKESAKRREEAALRREEDAKRREENVKLWEEEAKRREEWAEFRKGWEETKAMFDKSERQFAETKELFDRTDRKIEANNGEMGRLRNSFGEVIEHLVAPGIEERFGNLGMNFDSGKATANMEIKEGGKVVAEADIWLENDQTILVVEVKAKVKIKDVSQHKKRLEKIRAMQNRYNDQRKIIGAIAGAVFGAEQRKLALDAGFFVIAQTGDTMKMDVPENFKPREW